MLEQLFGIQYTGSVSGTVYGYYVGYVGTVRTASVHLITPSGNVDLGRCEIVAHNHAPIVRAYVESVI